MDAEKMQDTPGAVAEAPTGGVQVDGAIDGENRDAAGLQP
jgi:hypothetical protein